MLQVVDGDAAKLDGLARRFCNEDGAIGGHDCATEFVRARATDHIPEMVTIIEALIEKGHAYRVGDNVYFDVSTFPRYGQLSGNKVEELEAGARLESGAEA